MASQEEHIKQAQHNESFSLSIKETPYLDWVVTGIFYSALHYIEGYLAINDGHPDIHAVRNEMIEEDPNLGWRFYSRMYRHLRDDSYEARYKIRTFDTEEIQNDIIPLLNAIKNHLRRFVPQIRIT